MSTLDLDALERDFREGHPKAWGHVSPATMLALIQRLREAEARIGNLERALTQIAGEADGVQPHRNHRVASIARAALAAE